MLQQVRSPGPPWLPVPHFADTATVLAGVVSELRLVVAFALLDRSFRTLSATPWTSTGEFGLRLGTGVALVPNGAAWWAVSVGFPDPPTPPSFPVAPHEAFSVRWGLHL